MKAKKKTLGILGSGRGSNFQAIADAVESNALNAQIGCVISDVQDAFILSRAQKLSLPAFYVDPAPFKTKLEGAAEKQVIDLLLAHKVDLLILAGFMRVVKQELLRVYNRRIINIHPSLLPAFPGLEAWRQAFDYGVKVTGCTVHFVDAGVDTGKIILQEAVPVLENDTPESLHARIQEAEHRLYPAAVAMALRELQD